MSLEYLKVLGNKENIKQKQNKWGHVKGPPVIEPTSLALAGRFLTTSASWEPHERDVGAVGTAK